MATASRGQAARPARADRNPKGALIGPAAPNRPRFRPAPDRPRLISQDDVASCFDYYADLAEKLDARQYAPIDVGMEEFKVAVRREPLGVVGLVTPWNYPLLMSAVSVFLFWGGSRVLLSAVSVFLGVGVGAPYVSCE